MIIKKEGINKIADIFTNKHNFALVYISLLILRSVFFLQEYVDYGCKLCLAWGILIICSDLWKYRLKFFKVQNSFLPLLLCVAYGISVLVNYRYSLYGGIKNLMYCGIYLFLLYAIRKDEDKEKFFRYFKRNNDIYILLNALIALASIATFVLNLKITYVVDENQYKVGFWFNRLNGVCNSNMETILGLVSVVLCIINWYLLGEHVGKRKTLYISNMVLQFIYYSLSGSRAATICYAVMLCIFFACYFIPKMLKKKGIWRTASALVLTVALIVVGEHYLVLGTQFVMKKTVTVVFSLINEDSSLDETEEIEFERVEDFESGDITNNRSAMWRAAFKIIKQHPIWGVAYADSFDAAGEIKGNIDTSVLEESDMKALKVAGFYFHNGFVQMLLCGGIVFLALFVVFAAKMIYRYFQFIRKGDRDATDYKVLLGILMIIGALFIDNMVEVHVLFAGQDGVASFLWYLLGCGIYIITKNQNQKNGA